jgi:hypothetical protein
MSHTTLSTLISTLSSEMDLMVKLGDKGLCPLLLLYIYIKGEREIC